MTKMRIEQIARMRVNGIKDDRICELLNITEPVLRYIIKKPEYKDAEEAYLLGYVNKMDEAMAGNLEEMKRGWQVAVPAAMRCILDTVNQRRDLKAALAAAGEIFDRDPDGAFVKRNRADNQGVILQVPTVVFDNAVNDANKVAEEVKK